MITRDWSLKQLGTLMWVLEIEPRSPGRAAGSLNLRAISLVTTGFFLKKKKLLNNLEGEWKSL